MTYESFLKAFYVDDLLKAIPTPEIAIRLAKQLISVMSLGGFRLTKFMSNCKEVLDALPSSEVAPKALISIDDGNLERALGMLWDVKNDVFTFSSMIKDFDPSKRGILKCSSSIFDPRGFLGPFIMMARMILQMLWKLLCDWDELIEGKEKAAWEAWVAGAKKVSSIWLNRRYHTYDRQVSEIHIFCNASELAYASVAYLRMTMKDGEMA